MGIGERIWDTFAMVIRMNDKIETLSVAVDRQQEKLVDLTERMVRLETTMELLRDKSSRQVRQIEDKR